MTSTDARERMTCPFDHHAPTYRFEFREIFERLRATAPIVWSESHGGFWIAVSYEAARRLAIDAETFTVAPGPDRTGGLRIPAPPGLKTRPLFVPGESDGEEHDDYRLALNPHFSKARVAELAPMIERHVDGALTAALSRGEFDAIDELIVPILAGVASEHLGLDVPNPAELFRNMHRMISTTSASTEEFDVVKRTFESSWTEIVDLVRARRAAPRDDVISHLVAHTTPAFTDEQVQMMVLNVILGAFHTTSSLLSQILIHLGEDSETREHLRANPDQLPKAVDEFLRLKAVAIAVGRTATRDVEVEGASIKKGDRVMIAYASANHDPQRYPNPTEFDLERGSAQHLGMGVGTHFCLGAWLAKSIIATTVREVLARTDHLAFNPDRIVLAPEISNAFGIEHAPARVVAQ